MTMLDDAEQTELRRAIADVESRTDAELVTVLANRADNYYYIPTLWAALVALLTPLAAIFSPIWLDTLDVFLVQLLVFIVLAVLLRIPMIMVRIVPRRVREWRAGNLARREFLANGLHNTDNGMGLMIFVCQQEHYVEIIADQGIAAVVDNEQWAAIVETFVQHVKKRDVMKGFVLTVEACGEILARVAPATGKKDELPNHLVVVELG